MRQTLPPTIRLHFLLVPSLLFLSLSALDAYTLTPIGGYLPIRNINDPHVMEIANFAVSDYNKQSGAHLMLVKVVKGETRVVSGSIYRLVLATNDGTIANYKYYQAIVWEQIWRHHRGLISFQIVH